MALKSILDLRRFGVMLFALVLLLGGAIDVAACEPEADFHAAQVTLASGGHDGASGDQHGVCPHGHCHHASTFIPSAPMNGLPAAPAPAAIRAEVAELFSAPTGPPTQPPRA